MDGKDKILSRIKSDCDDNVRAIEIEAEKKCDSILSEAKIEAERTANEILDKAEKKKAQIAASSKSRAELEIRNALLKRRRKEIDITVDKISDCLLNSDDSAYFEFIYKLAAGLSGMSGEILLNQKDLNRLPADFNDRISQAGLQAQVNPNPVDISGGFILKHGDIEENMEFSALISSKRDELEDYVNRELFAE